MREDREREGQERGSCCYGAPDAPDILSGTTKSSCGLIPAKSDFFAGVRPIAALYGSDRDSTCYDPGMLRRPNKDVEESD
jgi:hypothetical protein